MSSKIIDSTQEIDLSSLKIQFREDYKNERAEHYHNLYVNWEPSYSEKRENLWKKTNISNFIRNCGHLMLDSLSKDQAKIDEIDKYVKNYLEKNG